jgi:hypothetical protein
MGRHRFGFLVSPAAQFLQLNFSIPYNPAARLIGLFRQ